MKFEILDDVVYIEIGRTISDTNYGNWKLSIRVPCRSDSVEDSINNLKEFIETKTQSWIDKQTNLHSADLEKWRSQF